jgi:UDP-N-acetylglucosamine 2-epimerase (hydrolysing)
MKTIAFLTGTRADYGKIKPLIKSLDETGQFKIEILVTGMHLLPQYGSTVGQVIEDNLGEVHFLPNQVGEQNMENALARTIEQLSNFIIENHLDLIVVHGDRIEALAGSIVGALRNIPTAHIEGGEVSGTVDGLIRHSVSKLAHLHFVSNESARERLHQLGENPNTIFVIGSPDIDVMLSKELPEISEVKRKYQIPFNQYSIVIFHPVTTEFDVIQSQIDALVQSLLSDSANYVIIKPNNDHGSEIIQRKLANLKGERFIHIPSMRFEYFLTLLKEAKLIIGNSSAGVREAPCYGVPTVNIGSRQKNRATGPQIVNVEPISTEITKAIELAMSLPLEPIFDFGVGQAAKNFVEILTSKQTWPIETDKIFVDMKFKDMRAN